MKSIIRNTDTALKLCSYLEERGFTYNKHFTIRDNPFSIFIDKRPCAEIVFKHKNVYPAIVELEARK